MMASCWARTDSSSIAFTADCGYVGRIWCVKGTARFSVEQISTVVPVVCSTHAANTSE